MADVQVEIEIEVGVEVGVDVAVDRRRRDVVAVIPVHGRVEQTLRCLQSLEAGTVVPAVVVVDDGSPDGTAQIVRRHYPDVVVLAADGHQWWAGATNTGVRDALARGANYVLTVNNDGVVDPRAVERLLAAERVCGPNAILSARRGDLAQPERVRSAGVVFGWDARRPYHRVPAEGDAPIRVDACGANAMLVPRACFDQVGLFDAARLPHCWADWDFQLRAREHGWSVYCIPTSVVLEDTSTRSLRRAPGLNLRHALSLVTSRRSASHAPSVWRFYRRHAPPRTAAAVIYHRYRRLAKSTFTRSDQP